jgi:HK97 gp10 family phage protein
MSATSFVAQIDAWVASCERRQLAVFRTSAQMVVERLDASCPVDTGALRASRQVLRNQPLYADASRPERVTLGGALGQIAAAKLTDKIVIGYTMAYAPFVEFGTSKMAPRAWVRTTIAQWPQIVAQATAQAKSAAGAS